MLDRSSPVGAALWLRVLDAFGLDVGSEPVLGDDRRHHG